MSSKVVHDEIPADARFPDWLLLSLIVMAGSAGYTVLAYLVWLWAS